MPFPPPSRAPAPIHASPKHPVIWETAARLFIAGESKRSVRKSLKMTTHQLSYMLKQPGFIEVLRTIAEADGNNLVSVLVDGILRRTESLEDLKNAALEVAAEALDGDDEKRKDRFAIQVLKATEGEKHLLEHTGDLVLSQQQSKLIEEALSEIRDAKSPKREPPGPSQQDGKESGLASDSPEQS